MHPATTHYVAQVAGVAGLLDLAGAAPAGAPPRPVA